VIKLPEHPVGIAFEKAREWAAEQERRLTKEQRQVFDALKHRQGIERQLQHQRLEGIRKQLDENAKKRQPKPELSLTPPVLVADPYVRRQARYVIAGEKRLERLDRRHEGERHDTLRRFEQDREKKQEKSLSASWRDAIQRTAMQERGRENTQEIKRDLDRSR
jgi:hypothetical protein